MTGGGMKGFKDAPDDWEGYVKDFFGIDRIGRSTACRRACGMAPRCSQRPLPHHAAHGADAVRHAT